ncbi:acetyltransferase [Pseudomonas sp. JS3066]|uniref:acetyltransferase n=1 Tax=unclassified Pseudomonas TaxID=196821 RepID=UPI000EAA71F3|nr:MULTISPECIES: acetyltransferase [unclassified Pseudomonas]AYF90593.1 acetyltransferase [Pseudomonas sp. DY-1]MDH4651756.1 acetyltransferase [Pseudomonas sp. BN606]MRK22996.1 acetyltransferase [Pseudomonas sp. JG-B]WVK91820.1 acetyltransferase [Pseudomonas sp. JS3066]
MLDHCAFNGDADGLCALQQLRLAGELDADVRLVSGVKRDIRLLDRVPPSPGGRVTVLDISHEQNRADVLRLLGAGARIRYFDHHFAGELPAHPAFESFIDTATDVCTGLLVNRFLAGRFHRWAVVAAFGDGMSGPARALAGLHGLEPAEISALEELGLLLNYNAYGDSLDDLHFDPLMLAAELAPYEDPLDFIRLGASFARLRDGYAVDMAAAARLDPWYAGNGATLYRLPEEPWARRVSGVLANQLASRDPQRALGLLSARADGDWTFSLRVPAGASLEADAFCRGFDGGGGRKRAAGINRLPAGTLQQFADVFLGSFPGAAR